MTNWHRITGRQSGPEPIALGKKMTRAEVLAEELKDASSAYPVLGPNVFSGSITWVPYENLEAARHARTAHEQYRAEWDAEYKRRQNTPEFSRWLVGKQLKEDVEAESAPKIAPLPDSPVQKALRSLEEMRTKLYNELYDQPWLCGLDLASGPDRTVWGTLPSDPPSLSPEHLRSQETQAVEMAPKTSARDWGEKDVVKQAYDVLGDRYVYRLRDGRVFWIDATDHKRGVNDWHLMPASEEDGA